MPHKGLTQGNSDGLCGPYAILNFLQQDEGWRAHKPVDGLFRIFEVMRLLNILDPHHLCGGSYDYELKEILDYEIKCWRLSWTTAFVWDFCKDNNITTMNEMRGACLEKRVFWLAHHDTREHTILVQPEGDTLVRYDSANRQKPKAALGYNQSHLSLDWGVVILSTNK